MAIVQKLVVDKKLTDNFQIVVRDETGTANPSNPGGYTGGYGNNYSIEKYIFELLNLSTGDKYTQIQSDDINNPDEYYNPSVARIINKENVTIDATNFDLSMFADGVYKLSMAVKTTNILYGEGFAGQNVITNAQAVEVAYNDFGYIIVDNDIYKVVNYADSVIVLDKPLIKDITEYNLAYTISANFILSTELDICVNKNIADFADNCDCEIDVKTVNVLSELQLYVWGLNRAVEREDIIEATKYFNLAKQLCGSLNCGCNG